MNRVTLSTRLKSAELSRRSRFFAAIVGVGLLAVLLLASQLRPDARGWGTHQQLGLPPCSLVALVGVRCPACGMTTSWALATRGRIVEAVRTHVTGTLLAVGSLVVGLGAVVVAASGRMLSWLPSQLMVAWMAAAVAGLILVEWILRLAKG